MCRLIRRDVGPTLWVMKGEDSKSGATGLVRSCAGRRGDQFRSQTLAPGLELLEAWFAGTAYDRHRHDTYAIGLTDSGVQCFTYRGARQASMW